MEDYKYFGMTSADNPLFPPSHMSKLGFPLRAPDRMPGTDLVVTDEHLREFVEYMKQIKKLSTEKGFQPNDEKCDM